MDKRKYFKLDSQKFHLLVSTNFRNKEKKEDGHLVNKPYGNTIKIKMVCMLCLEELNQIE